MRRTATDVKADSSLGVTPSSWTNGCGQDPHRAIEGKSNSRTHPLNPFKHLQRCAPNGDPRPSNVLHMFTRNLQHSRRVPKCRRPPKRFSQESLPFITTPPPLRYPCPITISPSHSPPHRSQPNKAIRRLPRKPLHSLIPPPPPTRPASPKTQISTSSAKTTASSHAWQTSSHSNPLGPSPNARVGPAIGSNTSSSSPFSFFVTFSHRSGLNAAMSLSSHREVRFSLGKVSLQHCGWSRAGGCSARGSSRRWP